jgi:hypothetical protein
MMQSSANVSGQFIFIIFTTFWNTSRGSCRRHSFRERSMPGPWVCKDVGFCNLGRLFQLVNLPGKTNICVSICATQSQYFLLTQRCRRDTIQTRTAHQAESNLAWRQGNVKHVIPGRKALIDQVFPGLWLVDILYIHYTEVWGLAVANSKIQRKLNKFKKGSQSPQHFRECQRTSLR